MDKLTDQELITAIAKKLGWIHGNASDAWSWRDNRFQFYDGEYLPTTDQCLALLESLEGDHGYALYGGKHCQSEFKFWTRTHPKKEWQAIDVSGNHSRAILRAILEVE